MSNEEKEPVVSQMGRLPHQNDLIPQTEVDVLISKVEKKGLKSHQTRSGKRQIISNKDRPLSKADKVVLKKYLETGNKGYALQQAGFNPRYLSFFDRANIVRALESALAKYNVTPDRIGKVISEGLDANIINEGEETIAPDHKTRHQFLDTTLKVVGGYAPEKKMIANVNIYEQLSDSDLDQELKGIEKAEREFAERKKAAAGS